MSYAGDVSCSECWSVLENKPSAQLVDVRTHAEWSFVGIPDLGSLGRETIFVEWQTYPSMEINPDFVENVTGRLENAGASTKAEIFMLCRSGVRSIAAANALTGAGFEAVFNVMGGFEGDPNADGQRGKRNGWKHDGLPWCQN